MTLPDNLEKGVRLGCGFFFGLVVGAIGIGRAFYDSGITFVSVSIIIAIVCALAALQFGNAFWHWLKDKSFWWI